MSKALRSPPRPPRAPAPLQPIYVLEKDNDLSIHELARQNAADVLRVQPEGPYLLGGHSYGGSVAMEIALVLEGWGHDVGLVLVRGGPGPRARGPGDSGAGARGRGRGGPAGVCLPGRASGGRCT
jgi:pimeloyl-ACP methyl ester carboxylesterase